jgi:DNA primase
LGCCPFHDEKTPSFNINPIKQFYYCFGCSASGNIITFLMEHDNLTFVEAITEVADSVGMSVPESEISNSIEFNNNFNNKFYTITYLTLRDTHANTIGNFCNSFYKS